MKVIFHQTVCGVNTDSRVDTVEPSQHVKAAGVEEVWDQTTNVSIELTHTGLDRTTNTFDLSQATREVRLMRLVKGIFQVQYIRLCGSVTTENSQFVKTKMFLQ